MIISSLINRLSESQTLAMSRKSREMIAEGHDIINLSLGEPDFNTPDFIKEAGIKAIQENYTKYMPVPGYLDLRQAVSEKFKRDNNLNYDPSQIVVSTGAKQSIANVCLSILEPGDEVILPAPFWVSYLEIIKLTGATVKIIPTDFESEYKITPEALKNTITDKSKMFLFSSPCNPSGSVYSKEELEGLAEVLKTKEDLFIVSDEIYEHINFTGKNTSIGSIDSVRDKTITVNGVSKAFAMTGWRVGYIGAPKVIAQACVKLQGQFTSGTCGIAQKAAKAALEANPNVTQPMVDAFRRRRKLMVEGLNTIQGIKCNEPEGAFYVFPDVSAFIGKSDAAGNKIESASDLCMYLLNNAHVSTVTGEAFGIYTCIRISYAAADERLKEALSRISSSLNKLS